MNVLAWPSHVPDLNATENLWTDLRIAERGIYDENRLLGHFSFGGEVGIAVYLIDMPE